MTMTRDEWLATLTWHDGPPPDIDPPIDNSDDCWRRPQLRTGLVIEKKDGERLIVGDVNDSCGACGCCNEVGERKDIVRWAEWFRGNP